MGMIGSLTDREYQKFKATNLGSPAVRTFSVNQLIPDEFDSIILGYTGDDITSVIYKINGTSGDTIATLTLGYSGGNLVSIERT